jgi:ParB family chromosome partitioning protein
MEVDHMARENSTVGEVQELPLSQITIGQSQVRTDMSSGIDELIESIRVQGLLQPILVVRLADKKYEILAGMRRFLAHQKLGYKTIRAILLDKSVDATAISLTENLIRQDNNQRELIDACTKLYKRYGDLKLVAESTGLTVQRVSQYVKYDQLVPTLKKKVDEAQLDMKVALQAQRAATNERGEVDKDAAEKFAKELAPLSNQQRKTFIKAAAADPSATVEEKIEVGRKQPVLKQLIVTIEDTLHKGLRNYAKEEGVNQDEAAAGLIEDGLTRRGFGGDQE